MKKVLGFAALTIMLSLFCVSPAVATVFDITTFAAATEQGRVARYVGAVVDYGSTIYGSTIADANQGLYDYASFPGNADRWDKMCDGSTDAMCNTFDSNGDDFFDEDFFGYMFKRPATVQEINFVNNALLDGGTFVAQPRIELLVGGTLKSGNGTWQTAEVTWNTPYVIDYGHDGTGREDRFYSISINNPISSVWGARIIGTALDGWSNSENTYLFSSDVSGFISVSEVQVTADVTIPDQIDLTTNLAYGQTPIWAATASDANPSLVTNGDYNIFQYAHTIGFDTTLLPDGKEFLGVMFDTPQSNVAALGVSQKIYTSGGCLDPDTISVEYTTDGGTTWIAATGLDIGRYAEDHDDLMLIPISQYDTELFTFNTITEAIDGIRMIGTPTATDLYLGDTNGFMGTNEFEVFAAKSAQIPGDANHDNKVDGSDVTILANHWQEGVSGGVLNVTWEMGDFNGDHKVDGSDVTILANHWQEGVTAAVTAVPEASTIVLLVSALIAVGFAAVRKNHKSA